MRKKTKRLHRRHITNKKHIKRRNTRKKMYRKRREILLVPGAKGVPLFNNQKKTHMQEIVVNQYNRQPGNMIPGLREYLK